VGVLELYYPLLPDLVPGQVQVVGSQTPALALASLLVLAFPEIHWLPYCSCAYRRELGVSRGWLNDLTFVAGPRAGVFSSLFDPRGLREEILEWLRQEPEGRGCCAHLPTRPATCAALDEEESYAAFTAYLAYRFGYRSLMVTTEWLATETLGKDSPWSVSLTFEDLYLSFPDRSGGHLSKLKERDKKFRKLNEARKRVFVTVGHTRNAGLRKVLRDNRLYLRSRFQSPAFVYKPLPGLHSTWQQAGKPVGFSGVMGSPASGARWVRGGEELDPPGHSAPGRLLAVADSLIRRAKELLAEPRTVTDALHAATLALNAKELLGGKTPTTALEALALQHEAEVVAECMFLGVDQNIELRERFREIQREVHVISQWFSPRTRYRSEINARLAIVERLARRFAELHQVEEELQCLAEARRLRFKFWARQRWWRWPLRPVLGYLSFCLSSLPRFVLVVVGWVLLFGLTNYLFALAPSAELPKDFLGAMVAAAKAFFTSEPAAGWANLGEGASQRLRDVWNLALTFQGVVSLLNLGLLISHLYLIVSRR
jgi:hypothetical protein